jgi:hypothetical protein
MTEEFFSEMYDAFIGSSVIEMPNVRDRIMIKPTPCEAEEMVQVVRDVFTSGGWGLRRQNDYS